MTAPGSAGRVISQNPNGGSRANAGSTVTITVGRGGDHDVELDDHEQHQPLTAAP